MRGQRGFTLVEILVALVLIGGLYAIVSDSFGPALAFRAEIETKEKQKDLRSAIFAAYKINALTVDAEVAAKLDFGTATGVMEPVLPDATTKRCGSTATTFLPVARFSGSSAGVIYRDGYGHPMCVFITPRLSLTISGSMIYYHSVAVVSPGRNGVIDTGTALDSATGNLTLAGDDMGVLLDGRAMAQDRYQVTIESIRRAADAYQAYFSVRYQTDPTRSISVNYFACGDDTTCPPATPNVQWDAGNGMPTTCAGPIAMFQTMGISPHAVLGLSESDVTDGYGNVITMDNCGAGVRNPSNPNVAMQTPPYTAVISTTLPGGDTLSQTAVGQF
jgi:prepilin-type N-terminal cleavage/methylation domain-containing protein